jgi:starvation-inducible outer membrane lipoprotein
MKNLLRTVAAAAALFVLAGCNSSPKTMNNPGMLADVCIMSGEKLDANCPTADFMGGKVGFCCEKCQAKWNSLDDNGKKIAFDAVKK